jgi:hypothetical protein
MAGWGLGGGSLPIMPQPPVVSARDVRGRPIWSLADGEIDKYNRDVARQIQLTGAGVVAYWRTGTVIFACRPTLASGNVRGPPRGTIGCAKLSSDYF